jgi:hypothetical protein
MTLSISNPQHNNFMLSFIMRGVTFYLLPMLNDIMLGVVMLNVIMLSVVALKGGLEQTW